MRGADPLPRPRGAGHRALDPRRYGNSRPGNRGPRDHSRPVRRALCKRRPGARRRGDRLMRSLLLHWLLNAAALWVAAWLLPGLDFQGTIVQLLLVAAVFGVVNSLLRPILTVLTCPLIVITLGLFTLVINAL